jgi:hypothetical protein
LTSTELALVDEVAALTGSKRTEVIKSALTVYHWFVRQALTGSRVVARKPTGEEVALETAELAVLEGNGNRLGPEELGLLAKRLAAASNLVEPARIKEHPASAQPEASQLELLAKWLDNAPEVPAGQWYERFSGMTVCGEVELIKTSGA